MFIKLNIFGLKCKVFNKNQMYEHKTMYQTAIGVHATKFNFIFNPFNCVNHEDNCFDELGKFTCFKCFDGTIISNNQVCNRVVDCEDLSDECLCENCKVKPLCEVFYKQI